MFTGPWVCAFNGKICKRALFALRRVGNPGGTVFARVRRDTEGADTIQFTFDTSGVGTGISANTISTTKTRYTFEKLNNTYALTTNDAITIEITGASQNGSNYISVYYAGDVFDGTNTQYLSYDNNYSFFGDRDIDGRFEE